MVPKNLIRLILIFEYVNGTSAIDEGSKTNLIRGVNYQLERSWQQMESNAQILFGRWLQEEGENDESSSHDDKRDFYEFIAFVCWYLFLILCCIIPTVCAFRRRRHMERRALANLESVMTVAEREGGLANLFGAWSENERLRTRQRREEEEKNILVAISECLSKTSMEVRSHNIITPEADDSGCIEEGSMKCMDTLRRNGDKDRNSHDVATHEISSKEQTDMAMHVEFDSDEIKQSTASLPPDLDIGDYIEKKKEVSSDNIEEHEVPSCCLCTDDGSSIGDDSPEVMLQLPPIDLESGDEKSNNARCVSASCAICLSRYKIGEKVTWSSNKSCPHVFHENCIRTWLTKLQSDNLLCPCCRQPFITIPASDNTVGSDRARALINSNGSILRPQEGMNVWYSMMTAH